MLEDVGIQIILRLKWSDSLQQASTTHLNRFGHAAKHQSSLAKYLRRGRTRAWGKHKEHCRFVAGAPAPSNGAWIFTNSTPSSQSATAPRAPWLLASALGPAATSRIHRQGVHTRRRNSRKPSPAIQLLEIVNATDSCYSHLEAPILQGTKSSGMTKILIAVVGIIYS